jgi:molybdate transport system ATP-binding protein
VSALRAQLSARLGTLALDVALDVGGEPLIVVGPNGAGKTSLLAALVGALPLARGRVEVGGDVLADTATGVDVPLERRRLGWVPQDFALFPHLTVRGNVAFAVGSAAPGAPRAEREARVEAILRELGLGPLADRRPAMLSGGEKQRAALARALSVRPRALLLDEPLAALDARARREMRAFLAAYLRTLAVPAVVVTHDAADARALGGTIAVLEAGRVIQQGAWDELAARPGSPYVAELVGAASGA